MSGSKIVLDDSKHLVSVSDVSAKIRDLLKEVEEEFKNSANED